MTKAELAKILADSVGNPSSGHVADSIDTMAAAVYEALNKPAKAATEKRVVEVDEKR